MSFQMYAPTGILFGAGQLNNLSIQKMPGKKALLVISSGKSVGENGALARKVMFKMYYLRNSMTFPKGDKTI